MLKASRPWLDRELVNWTLRHILELVLKLNMTEFDRKHYLQSFGTSMGAQVAPYYANIFMGDLEKTILESANIQSVCYKWFIDEIFSVKCTKPVLEELIRHMNNQNQNIQFTHEYSKSEINFLMWPYARISRGVTNSKWEPSLNKQINNYKSETCHTTPWRNERSCIWWSHQISQNQYRQAAILQGAILAQVLKRGYPRSSSVRP